MTCIEENSMASSFGVLLDGEIPYDEVNKCGIHVYVGCLFNK